MPITKDKNSPAFDNVIEQNAKLSFDEFLLFYNSAEKVTDRRLEMNRWNYSVCTAIVVACAIILGWATTNPNFLIIAFAAVIILSCMAILFCRLWIAQIKDFKMLNNAKFEVLNQMAPHLSFSESKDDARKSFLPFEKEWAALKKTKSTVELSNTNIFVLSSSNIEYLIPNAFTWLFILLICAVLILSLKNWGLIANSSALYLQLTLTPTILPTATP